VKWIIYYDDGSRYSSDDGSPYDARATGVIAIVEEADCPSGFKVGCEKPFYLWREDLGLWAMADEAGFWDYIFHQKGPLKILVGRTVSDSDYQRIVKTAVDRGLR